MNPQPSSHYQVTEETGKEPQKCFLVRASTEIWGLKSEYRSKETGRMASAVDVSI